MVEYYDQRGKPISMEKWVELGKNDAFKILGRTTVGESHVSTVWLGLNHNFMAVGPPLIFETMIFDGPHDQYQERYATQKEAIDGHLRVVKCMIEGKNPGDER